MVAITATSSSAIANHVFPDSTNGQAFHEQVGNVAGAGCTTGFPDGTFRPQDNVNRQQFAAWTNRCGGRVAHGGGSTEVATTSSTYIDVASVDLASGATGSGATGGFVYLSGFVTAETEDTGDAANCPCFVAFELSDGSSGAQYRGQVPSQEHEFGSAITPLSGFRVVTIPPDTTRTFTLRARFIDANVGSMQFVGFIQAVYVPFGPDGDNTLAFEP